MPVFEVPRKSCLLVDDSDVVRKVARHIFQNLKFDIRSRQRPGRAG
jgi:CheY-like chemotaxis protein